MFASIIAILVCGTIYQTGAALHSPALQVTESWNTFLGGTDDDRGASLVIDGSGNSFVAGSSLSTWASPVRAFTAGSDGYIAMLDPSGNLLWNTFLGGDAEDSIQGITLDESGNVYVIGLSYATWGSPLQEHRGDRDDFVAKLDPSGNLLWNTFLGVERNSMGAGIAVDGLGNIYVNSSNRPVSTGPNYAYISKLDSSGGVAWNISLGGIEDVFGHGVALDGNGDVYVTGHSYATWGTPVRDFTGAIDAFVAKLDNSTGELVWNTFLGGPDGRDLGYGLVLDGIGNIYMSGHSAAAWGSPVRGYQGDQDGLVVKLDPSGNLIWNTFLGGSGTDYNGYEIQLDGNGNIFVPGASNAPWGIPVRSYAGDYDASVVKLNASGEMIVNTFLGGAGVDKSYGIALGENGDTFVAGYSSATWGVPVSAYTGGNDAFVARINLEGLPESWLVTKADDTDDGACDSDCSLREAITAASSSSTIAFDPSLSGQTIALTSTLTIDKNLAFDGSNLPQNVQVSGDTNNDQTGDVPAIHIAANQSVEMNGINVVYGSGDGNGGGIGNEGFLTLKNCKIDHNRASNGAGIYNSAGAILTLSACTVSNNDTTSAGGGLANYGALEVTDSTFSNNVASGSEGQGSAIYNEGTSAISASTFDSNATGSGTIYHANSGNSTSLTVRNSSFKDNETAIYNADGHAAVNNTTIYDNLGGIYIVSGQVDISNTIVSHNFRNNNPADCSKESGGTIGIDNHNFFSSDSNCGVIVSGYGVSLLSLADNGGPTQTMALRPNSPAINAGDDATCETTDQRGVSRPVGSHCDIGSYEYRQEFPPMVTAILREGPAMTSSSRVKFIVTFSEAVTGVNASDFGFTKTGSIRGYSVTAISPSKGPADRYVVTVATGRYNGTLRLDVLDNDSIKDATLDPLGGPGAGNGNFKSGQFYTVAKKYKSILRSIASQDGWILESGEKTQKGGRFNRTATILLVGDNTQKKQYRSILSFSTKDLPDRAVITRVTLKVRKQSIAGSLNPINAFQGIILDVRKGYFGSSAGLQASDFQAATNKSFGPFKPALTAGWYTINVPQANRYINKEITGGGVTQIRLRFKLDDNNNKIANGLKLFSGNASAAFRPQLIIEYYVP